MLLNCSVGEDSWEFLGLQGDPTSPSYKKSTLDIHWKDWYWSWGSILQPPDVKNWLIGKDPDAGKDWRQEEKGTTEDEMVGWHHLLEGHEFGETPGDSEGQANLACCSPWGHKELGHNWTGEQQQQQVKRWKALWGLWSTLSLWPESGKTSWRSLHKSWVCSRNDRKGTPDGEGTASNES